MTKLEKEMLYVLKLVEHGSSKIISEGDQVISVCLWCQEWPHEKGCPVGNAINLANSNDS